MKVWATKDKVQGECALWAGKPRLADGLWTAPLRTMLITSSGDEGQRARWIMRHFFPKGLGAGECRQYLVERLGKEASTQLREGKK